MFLLSSVNHLWPVKYNNVQIKASRLIPMSGTRTLRKILKNAVEGVNPMTLTSLKNQSIDTNASELDPTRSGAYNTLVKKLGYSMLKDKVEESKST